MSKKKSSSNEKDDEKKIDDSEEKESSSIPLEDYEKIKDDYLRLAADFDNFKKRTEKDKENQLVGSLSIILAGLFPLIDNFEIAMNQKEAPKELEALYKLVLAFLENLNITEVPGVGEEFDPSHHEAIEHSGEGENQVVGEVLRKGYKLEDRLIRADLLIKSFFKNLFILSPQN